MIIGLLGRDPLYPERPVDGLRPLCPTTVPFEHDLRSAELMTSATIRDAPRLGCQPRTASTSSSYSAFGKAASQWHCGRVVKSQTLRECREALDFSQSAFAAELGVSPETYRVWDSGRRPTPARILERARALVAYRHDQALLPLRVLATLIGVHVRTLRNAARDGRLSVTYETRTTFRRLRTRATLADAQAFRRSYYERTVRAEDHRTPLNWSAIPLDYDVRIRALPQSLGVSQARFAELVGAARKAVVYQWESRKRAGRLGPALRQGTCSQRPRRASTPRLHGDCVRVYRASVGTDSW